MSDAADDLEKLARALEQYPEPVPDDGTDDEGSEVADDLLQPDPHATPPDLLELHEVLEWQAAAEAAP